MQRPILPVRLLLLLLFLPTLAHATTYYVSTTGSDGNGCSTNRNAAARHVQFVHDNCLGPGDTLYMRVGTYAESFHWYKQGTAGNLITLATDPQDSGQATIAWNGDINTDHTIIEIINGPQQLVDVYAHFTNFRVDGSADPRAGDGCIGLYMNHMIMDSMTFASCAGQVVQLSGDDFVFQNNLVQGCGRLQTSDTNDTKGYAVYGTGNRSLIDHNTIDGCRGGGFTINYHHVCIDLGGGNCSSDGTTCLSGNCVDRDVNVGSVISNNIIKNGGCSSPYGCISRNWDGGVRVTVGRGINFFDAGAPARVTVDNNVIINFHGSTDDGGNWASCLTIGGANGQFVNNTCYNVDSTVRDLCGEANSMILQNNIFAQMNLTGRIYCSGNSSPDDHNLENPSVGGTFNNAGGNDFTLTANSPARNFGCYYSGGTCNSSQPPWWTIFPTDAGGNLLRHDGTIDAGAYQFGTSAGGTLLAPANLLLLAPGGQVFLVASAATADSTNSGYPASNAIDGNTTSFWHTQFTPTSPPLPHTLTLDLNHARGVRGLRYLPRQDGALQGTIAQYRMETSPDNSVWTIRASGTFAADTTAKLVHWPVVHARYVRLVALTEITGNPWTSAAEVQILGDPNPDVVLPIASVTADSTNSGYAASRAIDGNRATFWHTEFISSNPPPPHTLTLDLGSATSVRALRYIPRQDGNTVGTFAQYRVDTSPNNSTWTTRASGTFAANTQPKQVDWTAVSVRYVRFVEVTEINGNPWGSVAEIQLLKGP